MELSYFFKINRMKTILHISPTAQIADVQNEFKASYPFLKLEFFNLHESDPHLVVRKRLNHFALLRAAGLKRSGTLALTDAMTVAQVEKALRDEFGLQAQVTRQSGVIWLETTMTDNWTLKQQNDHGREITQGSDQKRNGSEDFDLLRGTED
jgi:hypothetical protein